MTQEDAGGHLFVQAPLLASDVMSGAGLGFRVATLEDQAFMRSLYAEGREAELAQTGWPESLKQGFLDQQFQLQNRHYAAHHPHADRLILTDLNRGVGEQRIGRLYLDRTAPRWRLLELGLLTAWRSRGFGGLLLDSLAQAASTQGAAAIDLSVAVDNPRAQALYVRHGYRFEASGASTHRSMSRSFS